ncbi:MAG: hypothetical protein U5R31_10040 [Acidimicrobiia bacterium]|nr:hypothetical protein [Acidimicrobiia bacterium]
MRHRSAVALVGAVAGVVALVAALVAPAGAEEQDVSFAVTGGQVSVGAETIPLPSGSGGFTGVWDDETGELNGDFSASTSLTSRATRSPSRSCPPGVERQHRSRHGRRRLSGNLAVAIDAGAIVPGLTCESLRSPPPGRPTTRASPSTGRRSASPMPTSRSRPPRAATLTPRRS